MATYVLVHGSGAGGFVWRPVAKTLRDSGHTVYTPTLTGMGERCHLTSADAGLDMHIQDIANVLEFENLRDVIVVGHSYTGMVIPGVADRAPGRVGHLFYMDATIPRDGESQADVIPGAMAMGKAESRMIDGVLMAMPPGSSFYEGFVQSLKKHGQEWMTGLSRPLPYYSCYETKLVMQNPEAVAKIPTTAIRCTQVPWEEMQVERMKACDNYWELDSAHDLMIGKPEQTAELLLRVA